MARRTSSLSSRPANLFSSCHGLNVWVLPLGRQAYARLKLAGLHGVDYRTKTFSCSSYGSEAYFCLVEPTKEFGMHDYHLDEREQPERRPDAVKRLAF
jgi:hypothetical protein